MDFYSEAIKEGRPLTPGLFLEGSHRLVILLQDLDEELIDAELAYRRLKASLIEGDYTSAASETIAKASGEYKTYLTLKAKRDRVQEFILVSKKRASLQEWQS